MRQTSLQQSVLDLLQRLRGINPLKELFWSILNYDRVNQPLSRRGWISTAANALAEDPLLLAAGGTDGDFHIIYAKLNSEQLSMGAERTVVNSLLSNHPYALFVFSNHSQSRWHFLNVKYNIKTETRQLFRRITVGAGEQLRTATERLSLLDLGAIAANINDISPLAIGQRHDEAVDVEAVTQNFFEQYAKVFARVEELIAPTLLDAESRRAFTQKLFNRLMFIAFIQKKGWLNFKGRIDYLSALWEDYQQPLRASQNFYSVRAACA